MTASPRALACPRGSLFQYFGNKSDFYVFTAQTALERAWEFYEEEIQRSAPRTCFEFLTESLLSMASLKKREPELAAIYMRVVYSKESHAREVLYRTFVDRNERFYGRLIPWGIESGEIDPELPEASVRFHVHAVGSHFTYLVLSADDPRWLPKRPAQMRVFVEEIVNGLARALAPRRASIRRTKKS